MEILLAMEAFSRISHSSLTSAKMYVKEPTITADLGVYEASFTALTFRTNWC